MEVQKVITRLIVRGDSTTEGEYYYTDNPDIRIRFTPTFSPTSDGFVITGLEKEIVSEKMLYDQCAYGL